MEASTSASVTSNMRQRVITGRVEYLRADGTTEIVEQEYLVEDLVQETERARMLLKLSNAPTVVIAVCELSELQRL